MYNREYYVVATVTLTHIICQRLVRALVCKSVYCTDGPCNVVAAKLVRCGCSKSVSIFFGVFRKEIVENFSFFLP